MGYGFKTNSRQNKRIIVDRIYGYISNYNWERSLSIPSSFSQPSCLYSNVTIVYKVSPKTLKENNA